MPSLFKPYEGSEPYIFISYAHADADAVLDRVEGIRSRTVTERTGDTVRLRLSTAGDRREALFFAFAKAGLPLLELKPQLASLEDVFLDLTDDDDTVAARAASLLKQERSAGPAAEEGKEGTGHESDL